MLLIWGKNTKLLKMYCDEESKCENCNESSINYFVNQNYYHLFWIPVFPLLKSVGTYCSNCQNTKVEVFNQKGSEYENKTKTPIYMYTWFIIFILFIVMTIINTINQDKIEDKKTESFGENLSINENSSWSKTYFSQTKIY